MNKSMDIKSVTFFGSSHGEPGNPNFDSARAVAKEVAKTGRRVVNGGGAGVMLAATLGAKEEGGKTSVVYYKPELATMFEGKTAANQADESYEEVNYVTRTKRLLELGDAYIVFNGGTGTISEFGMAWGVARLYFGHHKPLILYGDFWKNIMEDFKKYMLVRKEEYEVFTIVNSPSQAIEALEKYEEIIITNRHKHKDCNGVECRLLL
ncbi:MAG: LOG family protein [Candidatus Levybacteria bacterium]|nr:LOG family protein [Candidatus Levybacteria bacterium]